MQTGVSEIVQVVVGIAGILLITLTLWETFETIILPRRVNRPLRFTRIFYRTTWHVWRTVARRLRQRETWLSTYGPLSLIILLGFWAVCLVFGFALLQWGMGSQVYAEGNSRGFGTDFYMSGTNFFTLGLGDVTPHTSFARFVTVLEGGTGFGFLGLVITYLPVIYQAFSRREVQINLLDARSGSPPCGAELLRRIGRCERGTTTLADDVTPILETWEQWCAELLESSFSYPALAYFRSQHENQSWIATLTAIMDTCVLLLATVEGVSEWRIRMTFGIARHAAVDVAQYLSAVPFHPVPDRLPPADYLTLITLLENNGLTLRQGADAEARLAALRALYEPFIAGLALRLMFDLPTWLPAPDAKDNWETTAWDNVL